MLGKGSYGTVRLVKLKTNPNPSPNPNPNPNQVRLVRLKSSGKYYALKCMLIEQVSKQAELSK